mmetsp:Transcript_32989/g.56388  ORF Transcript_32989/g.56388 Transcript_32989/m.56388 type:complete len:187 (+) Transcript_32989:41-601(+)
MAVGTLTARPDDLRQNRRRARIHAQRAQKLQELQEPTRPFMTEQTAEMLEQAREAKAMGGGTKLDVLLELFNESMRRWTPHGEARCVSWAPPAADELCLHTGVPRRGRRRAASIPASGVEWPGPVPQSPVAAARREVATTPSAPPLRRRSDGDASARLPALPTWMCRMPPTQPALPRLAPLLAVGG